MSGGFHRPDSDLLRERHRSDAVRAKTCPIAPRPVKIPVLLTAQFVPAWRAHLTGPPNHGTGPAVEKFPLGVHDRHRRCSIAMACRSAVIAYPPRLVSAQVSARMSPTSTTARTRTYRRIPGGRRPRPSAFYAFAQVTGLRPKAVMRDLSNPIWIPPWGTYGGP